MLSHFEKFKTKIIKLSLLVLAEGGGMGDICISDKH